MTRSHANRAAINVAVRALLAAALLLPLAAQAAPASPGRPVAVPALRPGAVTFTAPAAPLVNAPDLTVENITLSPPAPAAGQSFDLSVVVRNNGTAAVAIKFITALYLDHAPAGCGDPASETEWETNGLAAGAAVTLNYTFAAGLAAGPHTLWARTDAECAVGELLEDDNTLALDLSVKPASYVDLAVTKLDTPDPVAAGALLTYTIVVSNLGNAGAEGVVVNDPLPAGTAFDSAATTHGACALKLGVVECAYGGVLAGGESLTVTLRVTPAAAGVLLNSVTVYDEPAADYDDDNNLAQQATTVLSTPPPAPPAPDAELLRRAAQWLEDYRLIIGPEWEQARLAGAPVPLYRPDVDGPAYFEFRLEAPGTGAARSAAASAMQPAGFVILSTGPHDYPVAHWRQSGLSPTQELEQQAQAAGTSAYRFYKLDVLMYAAEDAQGNMIRLPFINPLVKTTNFSPAMLDAPPPQGSLYFTPTHAGPDLGGTGQISGGVVSQAGAFTSPITVTLWASWAEMLDGYAGNYAVPLQVLKRQAAPEWEIENLLTAYGRGLRTGDVYGLALLPRQAGPVSVDGPGAALLATELIDRGDLPPLFQITVTGQVVGEALPFSVFIPSAQGGEEQVLFAVVPDERRLFLPLLMREPGAGAAQALDGAPAGIQTHPGHEYLAAGDEDGQPRYAQMPAQGGPYWYPNYNPCASGCGPTALAMLFAWADNQAAVGNPTWAGRSGIYRQGGGYGANVAAPLAWDNANPHPELIGIKRVMLELRGYVHTFCSAGQGATLQWNMANAWRYLSGRSGARFQAHWNTIPVPSGDHQNRVIDAIVNRRAPAITGIGFIWDGHYPMAYGYRVQRVVVRVLWWENTEYRRQFLTNMGWGHPYGEWIPADTWFAGLLYP